MVSKIDKLLNAIMSGNPPDDALEELVIYAYKRNKIDKDVLSTINRFQDSVQEGESRNQLIVNI